MTVSLVVRGGCPHIGLVRDHSSLLISTVELTLGEVEHANDFQPSDLVVVDDIRWQPTSDGNFKARGGRVRIWSDWTPLKEDLAPRKFAYSLSPRFEEVRA